MLSALIYIHDVTCAVVEQHHKPFQYCHSCITVVWMHEVKLFKCLSIASGKTFQVFQAVFFPIPQNAETVSQPVNACMELVQILGSISVATSWTGIYRKLDLVPNANHSSSELISLNLAIANTTTSVSTVRTHNCLLLHESVTCVSISRGAQDIVSISCI